MRSGLQGTSWRDQDRGSRRQIMVSDKFIQYQPLARHTRLGSSPHVWIRPSSHLVHNPPSLLNSSISSFLSWFHTTTGIPSIDIFTRSTPVSRPTVAKRSGCCVRFLSTSALTISPSYSSRRSSAHRSSQRRSGVYHSRPTRLNKTHTPQRSTSCVN